MTREQIIKNLEYLIQFLPGKGIYAGETLTCAIAALRGPEWVRTVDRLPEDGERVLVTECGRVFVERFDRLLGFDTPTTHWMPMPEPPGVEVEG